MTDRATLQRLRVLLRQVVAVLLVGTIVELLLVGHTDSPAQAIPFVLCGLGLLALAAVWRRPGRSAARALRLVMALLVLGSLIGMLQHVLGNIDFARETQPDAPASRLLVAAVTGGAPLLAPGILALAAVLAIVATDPTGQR